MIVDRRHPTCKPEVHAFLSDDRIRAGWVELLTRYTWHYYATLTLHGDFHRTGQESLLKAFRWWLFSWLLSEADALGLVHRRDGQLRGPWINHYRKRRNTPVYAVGVERQGSGRLHLHAVIALRGVVQRLDFKRGHAIWNDDRGFAWLERVQSADDCAGYITKYTVKGGDLFLSDSFNAHRLQGTKCRSLESVVS